MSEHWYNVFFSSSQQFQKISLLTLLTIALALKKLPPKGNLAGGVSFLECGSLERPIVVEHRRSEGVQTKTDRLGIISFHHFLPWSGSIQKLTRSEKPHFKPSAIPRGFTGNQGCQELEWKKWKPREDCSSHLGCSLHVLAPSKVLC